MKPQKIRIQNAWCYGPKKVIIVASHVNWSKKAYKLKAAQEYQHNVCSVLYHNILYSDLLLESQMPTHIDINVSHTELRVKVLVIGSWKDSYVHIEK